VVDGVGSTDGFVNSCSSTGGGESFLFDPDFSRTAKSVVRAFRVSAVPLARMEMILLTPHHVNRMGGAAHPPERTLTPLAGRAEEARA
jgi:hypothetical protein